MRRKRAMAFQFWAVVMVVVTSVIFSFTGPRLRAQNPLPESVGTESKGEPKSVSVPKAESEPDLIQIKVEVPPIAPVLPVPSEPNPPAELPPSKFSETVLAPVPERNPLPASLPDLPTARAEPPTTPTRVLPTPSRPQADLDPEAAANGFVERTTKEADEAVRALTKEAEALRARLQKVEAGLSRWQSVKAALESNGGRAAWRSSLPPSPRVGRNLDEPEMLEPISGSVIPPPISRSRSLPALPDHNRSPFEVVRPAVVNHPDAAAASETPAHLDPVKPDAVSPPPTAPAPKPTEPPKEKK